MPTNLPPVYYDIEKRFREAETTEEKIELLQEMYSVVPKHKGTDHLRAELRRKLAKLNQEAQSQKSSAKRDHAFRIPKAGAGQAVFVGPANAGKSALLQALTGEESDTSPAPHATWEPRAAMTPIENVEVQLVDTPSLDRDYIEPRLKELIRRADLVLLVVDLQQDPIEQLQETVRLLEDFRVAPVHLKGQDTYLGRRRVDDKHLFFLPFLVLVNKCDDVDDQELYHIFCELMDEPWPCLPVSAVSGYNLDELKRRILANLDILRVYTKAPGKEPDSDRPFVLKKGSTLEDLAGKIHKDFLEKMKFARVWGKSVFDGQMVQRDYVLQDGDIVEIHV